MASLLGLLLFGVLVALPVLGLLLALTARSRVLKVEAEVAVAAQRLAQAMGELARLHREVQEVRREQSASGVPGGGNAVAEPIPFAATAPPLPIATATPPEVALPVRSVPAEVPATDVTVAAMPAQAREETAGSPGGAGGATGTAAGTAPDAAETTGPCPEVQPVVSPGAEALPQIPSQTPEPGGRPAPEASAPTPTAFDWESLVGVRLFSWVAGIALVVAAVLFLRYSVEQGWLAPPIRMAIGLITGVALLVVCELRVARRYRVTANAMNGAAIAVLFATFFAGHVVWRIVPAPATFALMALTAVVAVGLSIRRDAPFIALLGLAGGFATPALLSTGLDRPVGLFGYLLLLNAALAWVARRRSWPLLTLLSVGLTAVYQWTWVSTRLTSEQLPLAAAIFLVFPPVVYGALALKRRSPGQQTPSDRFLSGTAGAGGLLPLLFAIYMAAVPGYGEHLGLLFGFLILVDVGLLAVAVWRGPEILHLAAGLGTALVLAVYVQVSHQPAARLEVLAAMSALALLYLGAPWLAERLGKPMGGTGEQAMLAGPLLLFAVPAILFREAPGVSPLLHFGVLAAALVACAVAAAARHRLSVYLLGVVMALGAETIWVVRHLTAAGLTESVTIVVSFSLLYLAVPLAARQAARALPGGGALAFQAVSGHLLLVVVALQGDLLRSWWPLLVGLLILVAACGLVAVALSEPRLHVASMIAATLVLLVLTATVEDAPWPGVVVLAGATLAGMGLGWLGLARRFLLGDPSAALRVGAGAAAWSLVAAHLIGIGAGAADGAPTLATLIALHLLFVCGLLGLAAHFQWHGLALLAVLPSAWAAAAWAVGRGVPAIPDPTLWLERLAFATAMLVPFLAYPLALGRRVGDRTAPHGAAVVASVPFFFNGWRCMLDGNLKDIIGVLPVVLAGVHALLMRQALGLEPAGERRSRRLPILAGAALAFVIAAVPMQLDKEWITIGWTIEGVVVAYLFTRVRHRGLVLTSMGLLGAVFVRLVLNPAVFTYYPRSATPVLNWYAYTYGLAAAAFFLTAWWLSRTDDSLWPGGPQPSRLLPGLGTVLLFWLLNIEIADYFSIGPRLRFSFFGSTSLAQSLACTLGWAAFAIGLLVAGVLAHNRKTRIAAIALLAATVLKGFLLDLSRLAGLYRVASFVGLAVSLAAVAMLLQRFVLAREEPGE